MDSNGLNKLQRFLGGGRPARFPNDITFFPWVFHCAILNVTKKRLLPGGIFHSPCLEQRMAFSCPCPLPKFDTVLGLLKGARLSLLDTRQIITLHAYGVTLLQTPHFTRIPASLSEANKIGLRSPFCRDSIARLATHQDGTNMIGNTRQIVLHALCPGPAHAVQ